MSKAVLVMDMPKKCTECDICQHEDEGWLYCTYCHRNAHAFDIPDWCPLKLIPDKMEGYDSIKWQWGEYEDGWNHCIDSLIGE